MSQGNNDVEPSADERESDRRERQSASMQQTVLVRQYLESLEAARQAETSPWSLERSRERRDEVQALLGEAVASGQRLKALELTQQVIDATERVVEAERRAAGADQLAEHEAAFIEVGREWAIRKRITYRAFRRIGVPAHVLKAAKVLALLPEAGADEDSGQGPQGEGA